MRVVASPPIGFKCTSCGARNEGDLDEFRSRYTIPPSWDADCGFCHTTNIVYPTPLIAREVGMMAPGEALAIVRRRLG